jgi:hypothetical protein
MSYPKTRLNEILVATLMSVLILGGCTQGFKEGMIRGMEQGMVQPSTKCIYKESTQTTHCYTY